MKKAIVFLTALTLMFSAAGCGKEVVVNEYGEETFVYGDLIEISHRDYNTTKRESLVYDKNTKLCIGFFMIPGMVVCLYLHITSLIKMENQI